jgi:uncharacterized protein (UPF0332 family)
LKPETKAYLARAEEALSDAKRILAINIPGQAARLAYYAAFHAAKALVFERTGKIHKSHDGVRAAFNQLSRSEASIDLALRKFLTRAYDFKIIADYDMAPAGKTTPERAVNAVAEAERFVATIRGLLP